MKGFIGEYDKRPLQLREHAESIQTYKSLQKVIPLILNWTSTFMRSEIQKFKKTDSDKTYFIEVV